MVSLKQHGLWLEHSGKGQTIIFIHGFSLDARMWDAQFEFFARSHQVVRYDMRGFGRSALPTEPYRHINDLKAILDNFQLEQATLVGLSMGGGIALDFALEYPERVQSLILVDSILGGHVMSSDWEAAIAPVWVKGRTGDKEGARHLWMNHELFKPVLVSKAAEAFKQIVQEYSGWHWVNKNPHIALKPPAIERLETIQAPTLVVIGEHDLPDFHEIADTLTKRIPKAQKLVIPEAGHMSTMEAPETFNKEVLEFLGERI